MSHVPGDCWANVCDFLRVREHIRLSLCSASLHQLVATGQAWNTVDFGDLAWEATDGDLRRLLMSAGRVLPSAAKPLSSEQSLTSVLSCSKLSLAGVSHFDGDGLRLVGVMQKHHRLIHLNFEGLFKIRDFQLQHLHACGPSLTHLNLSRCRNITAGGLSELLPRLPHLKELDLTGTFGRRAGPTSSQDLAHALLRMVAAQTDPSCGLRSLRLASNSELVIRNQPAMSDALSEEMSRLRFQYHGAGKEVSSTTDSSEQKSSVQVPLSFALAQITTLTSLSLRETATNDGGLAQLSTLTCLTELDVSKSEDLISDEGLSALLCCAPHMQCLVLQTCTLSSLDAFAELSYLEKLDLSNVLSDGMEDDNFRALSITRRAPAAAGGNGFRCLSLRGLRFGDAALHHLRGWAGSLTELDLTGWVLSDKGLADTIADMRSLTSLTLDGCHQLTSAGMSALCAIRQLRHLSLNTCMFVDAAAIRNLHALSPSLRSLELNDCFGVDDACCAEIARGFTRLTNLDLSHCARISDEGVACMASLSLLKHLSLGSIQSITLEGIRALSGLLSSLTMIDLRLCKSIDQQGLEEVLRVNQRVPADFLTSPQHLL